MLVGVDDDLDPVAQAELADQALRVGLDRRLLDHQFRGDLRVGEPVFLRSNGYSLARALGAAAASIAANGPGAFGGPFVPAGQAVAVLAGLSVAFLALARTLLVRRDIS